MTTFWIMTGAMALGVAVLLALALMRGKRDTGPAEAFDMTVYRDQLTEIDRDLARGVISAEDAERLRTEVSRRLLSADARAQAGSASGSQSKSLSTGAAAVLAVVVVGASFGLYRQLGAPGYGDLALVDRIAAANAARENRPSQAEAEASLPAQPPADAPPEYVTLVERLRETTATRPDDLQGQVLLARSEAALGNYRAAYEAQRRVLDIKGAGAPVTDITDLADMMILAAGGYVSPEAEAVLEQAMQRDPQNGVARYYAGLLFAQTGRPDMAFTTWDRLLRESPSDAPWIPPITAQIEDVAMRAGVNFTLPDTLPGPSRADMEAAEDMSPEDRQAMIEGMVAQLSDRLATEGGTPEEWGRLITALMVLGDEGQAITIWNEAQQVFQGNEEAIATIRAAAQRTGLVP